MCINFNFCFYYVEVSWEQCILPLLFGHAAASEMASDENRFPQLDSHKARKDFVDRDHGAKQDAHVFRSVLQFFNLLLASVMFFYNVFSIFEFAIEKDWDGVCLCVMSIFFATFLILFECREYVSIGFLPCCGSEQGLADNSTHTVEQHVGSHIERTLSPDNFRNRFRNSFGFMFDSWWRIAFLFFIGSTNFVMGDMGEVLGFCFLCNAGFAALVRLRQPDLFSLDGPQHIKVGWAPHVRKGEPIISLPPPSASEARDTRVRKNAKMISGDPTTNPVSRAGAKQTPGPAGV
jgi:hypothetical protein